MLTRSRVVLASSLLAICLALFAVQGASATSALTNWWHNLSQNQRNSRIVERALQDVGDDVGQSCKEWVRTVVRSASGNTVTIPPNSSNDTRWQSDPDCHRYAPPFPPGAFVAGYIIQMRWRNNDGTYYPHTAIVQSRNSSGMWWIESNWEGDEVVRRRFVPFSTFHAQVGSRYSVYRIE
jgi:hypothetical protein